MDGRRRRTLTGFAWEDSTTDLGRDQVIFSGSAVGPDRTPIDESCEWSPAAGEPLTDEMIEAMFLSVRERAVPDEPTTTVAPAAVG